MDFDISKAEREIAELQAKVDKEKARLAAMTPQMRQAELLHKTTCRLNHIDACGWEYATWDNLTGQFNTKRDYLARVAKLSKDVAGYGLTLEQALEIYKKVRGY